MSNQMYSDGSSRREGSIGSAAQQQGQVTTDSVQSSGNWNVKHSKQQRSSQLSCGSILAAGLPRPEPHVVPQLLLVGPEELVHLRSTARDIRGRATCWKIACTRRDCQAWHTARPKGCVGLQQLPVPQRMRCDCLRDKPPVPSLPRPTQPHLAPLLVDRKGGCVGDAARLVVHVVHLQSRDNARH